MLGVKALPQRNGHPKPSPALWRRIMHLQSAPQAQIIVRQGYKKWRPPQMSNGFLASGIRVDQETHAAPERDKANRNCKKEKLCHRDIPSE